MEMNSGLKRKEFYWTSLWTQKGGWRPGCETGRNQEACRGMGGREQNCGSSLTAGCTSALRSWITGLPAQALHSASTQLQSRA